MESEIARAVEAGEFRLQGVQPICVFALYITEMSNLAFLLSYECYCFQQCSHFVKFHHSLF